MDNKTATGKPKEALEDLDDLQRSCLCAFYGFM